MREFLKEIIERERERDNSLIIQDIWSLYEADGS
jgi:hypothetical protein